MRLAKLTILLLAACSPSPEGVADAGTDRPGAETGADVQSQDTGSDLKAEDAGAPACTSLSECDCWAASSRGCRVVTESCWCPYPTCSTAGACVCGGGSFVGCIPENLDCSAPSCKPVDRLVGPDAIGCYSCAPQTDCDAARDALKTRCGLGDALVAGLSCDRNTSCVLACLNKVSSCSEVGCSFCLACGCVGTPTPLSTCYAACQQ